VTTAEIVDEPGWRSRPRPARTTDNAYYWDGMAHGELRLQRCASCHAVQHPPEPLCMTCGSGDLDHTVASGRGAVFSRVTYHEPHLPGFAYPYVVAVVTLDEGPRVIANVIGAGAGEVAIGDRVRAMFRRVDAELSLVAFERDRS
jgi:uncharacterized protein